MIQVYQFDVPELTSLVAAEVDGEICLLCSQGIPEAVAELQRLFPNEDVEPGRPGEAVSEAQIREYAAGKRKVFDLPLRLSGSPFRQRVWTQLCTIPFGQLTSYRDVAAALKSAPRPVGGALAANPVAIVVPCHRVVAADGSIGGYSGGLELKRKLLALEGIPFPV